MNKYEVYVNSKDLLRYIETNGIQDLKMFSIEGDFHYAWGEGDEVNFWDASCEIINGISEDCILNTLPSNSLKVSPEEFLIAIGYEDELDRIRLQHFKEINTKPFNKYKVYVDCKELTEYYKKYGLDFEDGYEFEYLDGDGVSYINEVGVTGYSTEENAVKFADLTKVDLHTFITNVLEEEWKASEAVNHEKLKVEDVHYFDEHNSRDFLSLVQNQKGRIFLQCYEQGYITEVCLSPESLVQLGQDLIRIGVQQQIKEDKDNE